MRKFIAETDDRLLAVFFFSISLMIYSYSSMPETHTNFIFELGVYWGGMATIFFMLFSTVLKVSFWCLDSEKKPYIRWGKLFVLLQSVLFWICTIIFVFGTVALIGPEAPKGAKFSVLATMIWVSNMPLVLCAYMFRKHLSVYTTLVLPTFLFAVLAAGVWDVTTNVYAGITTLALPTFLFMFINLFRLWKKENKKEETTLTDVPSLQTTED